MAGRKPKPTKLKILQGNAGKRPLNKHEPEPELALPDPPSHLSVAAIREWNRIVPELMELQLLSRIDAAALAAYCQAYSRWVKAEEGIERAGLLIKTTNGNLIQSPLVGIANKSMLLMGRFLSEFGMTPSSRARLSVQPKDKSPDKAESYF